MVCPNSFSASSIFAAFGASAIIISGKRVSKRYFKSLADKFVAVGIMIKPPLIVAKKLVQLAGIKGKKE